MNLTTLDLYCVCDEEFCYCTNLVKVQLDPAAPLLDVPCDECAAGLHVWVINGPHKKKETV